MSLCACVFASFGCSAFINRLLSVRLGNLSYPGISVYICSRQVRSHGRERSVSHELLALQSPESKDVYHIKVSISSDREQSSSTQQCHFWSLHPPLLKFSLNWLPKPSTFCTVPVCFSVFVVRFVRLYNLPLPQCSSVLYSQRWNENCHTPNKMFLTSTGLCQSVTHGWKNVATLCEIKGIRDVFICQLVITLGTVY